MLNERPVFIMGFAYGGSNILLNLLRSHPDLCSPRGELNEVFKGKLDESFPTRIAKCLRYFPCLAAEGYDLFRFNSWEPRKPMKKFTRRCVDKILYDEKLRARGPSQNRFKSEFIEYTEDEIARSRLLCKCLDGLIFMSDELSKMYPQAVFLALVRNGFAVSEGHLRRGYDLETFVSNYEKGCQKMIADAERIPNYHILRYEDIIAEPRAMLKWIYDIAGLDLEKLQSVRLETKKVIGDNGRHEYVRNARAKIVVWYRPNEFHHHFLPEANENQIRRLTEEQKETILKHAGASLEYFGYL